MNRYIALCSVAVALMLVCGCSQPQQPAAPVATATPTAMPTPEVTQTEAGTVTVITTKTSTVSDNTILIEKKAFNPATMTVTAGSIVRWRNKDSSVHTIVFSKESRINPSGPLSASQSFSVKFDTPGTYLYSCGVHPDVTGSIIVT